MYIINNSFIKFILLVKDFIWFIQITEIKP